MKRVFPPEWRTQNKAKRRFYAKYMGWLEKGGFLVVTAVFVGFIYAFNYPVEDTIKADGVQLKAASIKVKSDASYTVVSRTVQDFEEVKSGQEIGKVVASGEPAGKPVPNKTIYAPADGVVKGLAVGEEVEAGDTIIEVLDYSKLEAEASLEGQTVAKAAAGQKARFTSLNIPSSSMTLFRGSAAGQDIISGQLIDDEVRSLIQESLKGQKLGARDEIVMEAGEIKQIQIDAKLDWKEGGASSGITLDPSSRTQFPAEVMEGTHEVNVQIAQLPPDLRKKVEELLRSKLDGKAVTLPSGGTKTLGEISSLGIIVQMSARQAQSTASAIPAAVLGHKFSARVSLPNAPAYLSEAVRRADKEGKSVTARVEVVTGTRPIALLLLRRS